MADLNVQLKSRNGAIWDTLYPTTKAELVQETTEKQFVTAAQKTAWNNKQDSLGFTPEDSSKKGVANGYAGLDAGGKVPASQLPSYVDDVLEYVDLAGFPATGEEGKIYVAKDTNKTYRWSGSAYVEISASLALGETSATAYPGDKGKTAYEHSQSAHAPANAQKNSDITKAEIEAKLTGTITSHTHAATAPSAHAASHITGGSDVIPDVTATKSGLMSPSQRAKLEEIEPKANRLMITVGASEPSSPVNGDFWFAVV